MGNEERRLLGLILTRLLLLSRQGCGSPAMSDELEPEVLMLGSLSALGTHVWGTAKDNIFLAADWGLLVTLPASQAAPSMSL